MHNIFTAIENDNFSQFSEVLQNDDTALLAVDNDNWGVLSLVTQYQMPEYVEALLQKMTVEQINSQNPHPLFVALENKDYELFNFLLNHEKVDVQIKAKSGDNLVALATVLGEKQIIENLLAKDISPITQNNMGQSAVSNAIYNNKTEIFELFEQLPTLYSMYDDLWIKYSIQTGNVAIFEKLYPHSKLSPDEMFKMAYEFGKVNIASIIVNSGDFLPGTQQITEIVELMCQHYDVPEEKESSRLLADYLFEIKTPFHKFVNQQGQSAWMLSIQNDNEEVFKRLVESDGFINAYDTQKHTPLFYAIEKNNPHFVKLLLKKKANPNQTDGNKDTPLIKAVKKGKFELVEAILEYPSFVNEVNRDNENALSLAIKFKRMDMVSAIIWAGGEITTNPASFVDHTDLIQFNGSGQYEKITTHTEETQINNFQALSKLGFRLNQVNESGDTFMLHFIKNGYLANFKALLRCSLDPNHVDTDGNSAIMCAMTKNSDAYAIGLLNRYNNLDLTILNKDGLTVYDIACKQSKTNRLQELVYYDDNISQEDLEKVLPIIARDGELEKISRHLNHKVLEKTVDTNGNNLLMLAVAGNNKENFEYILNVENFKISAKNLNNNDKNLVDLISALPEEDGAVFTHLLGKYVSTHRKKP